LPILRQLPLACACLFLRSFWDPRPCSPSTRLALSIAQTISA
jgi:hypothetical protein